VLNDVVKKWSRCDCGEKARLFLRWSETDSIRESPSTSTFTGPARELDRERTKLEQQEKKLISDIKKSAKAGQMPACKVIAKDLVRTRRRISKFYQMKTQLQGISLRIQVSGRKLPCNFGKAGAEVVKQSANPSLSGLT
jgi:hypothetical protein